MTHIHWVARQNELEIPNDEEEVNTREIHKCANDGNTATKVPAPRTEDCGKRVVFGDLLLHLVCVLFSVFVPHVIVLVQKLNNNSHTKCKSKSPNSTRLPQSPVPKQKPMKNLRNV